MRFKFSRRSVARLDGIHAPLAAVAYRALQLSPVDFGISSGFRSAEEQMALYRAGKSRANGIERGKPGGTGLSRHQSGRAFDVFAWVDGKAEWEVDPSYILIAAAVAEAAYEKGVSVRWGGAWTASDIGRTERTETALRREMRKYAEDRKARGRKPFIDAVHFEIPATR